MERRHPNVVNLHEVETVELEKGRRFLSRSKALARAASGVELAANWFEVPPGKTAFPFHYHCAIEEGVFVLEGTATLRIGAREVAVRAGDWITHLAGPDHGHQLLNTGDAPLRYLCISNRARADVVGYPDSGKIAARAPDPAQAGRSLVNAVFKENAAVDYYEGESD
jgi:uncharacterized cupin superfamily protein